MESTGVSYDAQLAKKLQWLTLFRVAIISFLFGATFVFGLDEVRPTEHRFSTNLALYYMTTFTYMASFGYLIALRMIQTQFALVILTYAQLMGDVVLSCALVTITGGTESVFSFLFSLTIVNAAIILYRRGAFVMATLSSLFFFLISLSEMGFLPEALQFHGVSQLPGASMPGAGKNVEEWLSRLLINVGAFYAIAFLSSYLSEQLRRTSEEYRETRDSLETLKALHQNIVSSIRTGLITITSEGRITFFNEAAEDLSGLDSEEVLGRDIDELFPALQHILENEDKKTLVTMEVTAQVLKGKRSLLQWNLSPLKDVSGEQTGQVIFVQDVTRMKHMEEQYTRSRQLAVIGELSARIAHEIRNPLASISGCVQMLEGNVDDQETSGRLRGIILREIDHLNVWISEFLEFSGPIRPEKRSVDLGDLLNQTAEAFRLDPKLSEHSVTVESRGKWYVKADPIQLRQVIWNLLTNSAQSMPFGGTILMGMDLERRDGTNLIRTFVRDEGEGIPEEVQEKIFEPFFTTKQGGTGLGLATCFRIIEEHNGDIEVESQLGKGSTISVYLPQHEGA
jgi:two-component system, NtrC family, sensor histidine kinase PilS